MTQTERITLMPHKSEAWHSLIQVVSNVEIDLGKLLQTQHGLGLSEYRALDILARSPNTELRMQELASHLGLNQSSVSRLVERLERAGLTVRDLCPDDKRGVYTVLTAKGQACLEAVLPSYKQALDTALKQHGGDKLLPKRAPKTK